jgi:hypothetical protein
MPPTANYDDPPHDESPVGTLALLCIIGVAMTAGWLFLYFGVFIPRGVVQ